MRLGTGRGKSPRPKHIFGIVASPFNNPAGRAPEQASAYVRSIIELLGDRDPLAVMSQLAQELKKSLGRISVTELRQPEAPGKWSMHDVVVHLADSEVVFGYRLRMVIAQDRPTIIGFDQDAWSARVPGAYPDSRSAIQQVAVLREGHVALLRSLTDEQWERVGIHSERGPESVRLMSRLYAGHDLVHLRQLARIRTSLGR
jgi:hypothetical protein